MAAARWSACSSGGAKSRACLRGIASCSAGSQARTAVGTSCTTPNTSSSPEPQRAQLGACEDAADVLLGIRRHHREHLVAGLEHRVAAWHHDVLAADDGDDRGVAGDVDVFERAVDYGRVLRQRDLDESGLPALELQDPHEPPHADRLFDERGDEVRGGDRQVDPPVLVEHPLVLRMVYPGDHSGNRELLLGEQRDDEIVLVVASRRDDDVAALEAGLLEGRHLARVGDEPLDALVGDGALDDRGVLLDELHVVSGRVQVVGDEEPDVAGAGDRDPHRYSGPCSRRSLRASIAVTSTMKCNTSPSCPTSLAPTIWADPSLVTAVSQKRPGSFRGASFLPPQAFGSTRSTRHTLALGSIQSCGCSPGSRRRSTWSVVHDTVATVGMPRRW